MSLVILRGPDIDVVEVQQRVKVELDKITAQLPSGKTPVTKVAADYTVLLADALVLVNAPSTTPINVTLPDATTCAGEEFTVKNISTAGTVILRGGFVTGARQSIDAVTAPQSLAAGARATVYSDGVQWWVVA